MLETFDKDEKQFENGLINWKIQLTKWKRQYLAIIDLIDQINSCFGIFLLIFITGQFVRTITTAFTILKSLRGKIWDGTIFFSLQLLIDYVHLIPLVYTPYRIRQKV